MRIYFGLRTLACSLAAISLISSPLVGQQQSQSLKQPVYRVSKAARDGDNAGRPGQHPLDPALQVARDGLANIQQNVRDYNCVLVKRERINGKLTDQEYMFTKVRNEKRSPEGQIIQPFSVYMYFLKPETVEGREVLYVEGQNDGKMIAREGKGVISKLPPVWIRPDGPIAMKGCLYPITDVGIENLVAKLIERGERDRHHGECEVEFHKGADINGRRCTMLQVTHPVPRPHFDFHVARIFIDDELNVPIRYAAYGWPEAPGGKPVLLEEYTYLKLNLNVGLTDEDFDPKHKKYNFYR